MPVPRFLHRKRTYFIGIPILIFLVAVVAPYVYIHFIEGPAPAKLKLSEPKSSPSTTASGSDSTGSSTDSSSASVDGTWQVTKDGTTVGYRGNEVMFGQSATAVGRTDAVTGQLTLDGTTATAADFTADLTKVASDQGNRDNQFQGRIMDTSTYPTAMFKLTSPIELSSIPENLVEVSEKATGDLTLRG